MKNKILVYAHYFYPDVASTGQILTELFESLSEYFDITVISAVPSYSGKIEEKYKTKKFYIEKYKNVKLIRVRVPEFDKKNKFSRIKNILSYFFNAISATFKSGKQDIIFTISQPPVLGGILGTIGKIIKHGKLIYNIQDFNPEQIEAVKYSHNKTIINILKSLDKFSCKHSDMIVVVGNDMIETLKKRFKDKIPKNIVINNWIDEKDIFPLKNNDLKVMEFKKKYNLQNKFIFMYSGNLGLYYDLENIIKVMAEFKNDKNIAFVFVGNGVVKNKLVDFVTQNNIDNIKFIPYQKKKDLIYSLNAADVHIVTNAKGIKGISVPSKIYGILAAGKFSLGILEKDSEARNIIENSGSGICVEPNNYKALKEVIIKICKKKEIINNGLKGREYLEKYLAKDISVMKYKKLIESLIN